MKKGIYLKLQLKRAFKVYPMILIVTIITLASIVVTCGILVSKVVNGESKQKISLGIVGDSEENYLSAGLYAIENVDSVRFSFDFIEMKREEAAKALDNREISGYVDIPNGFIDSIFNGRNQCLKYVTRNGPAGFGASLTEEFTVFISDMVTETQRAIYSMQELTSDLGMNEEFYKQIDEVNYAFLDFVLNRADLYDFEDLSAEGNISLGGYYVCGMILFFILIWGISCNKILTAKNTVLSRLLNSVGLNPIRQILSEYTAYFAVTFVTSLIVAIAAGVFLEYCHPDISELEDASVIPCIEFVLKIVPLIVMITMMQFAFYEFISNTVAAVLTQFLIAIGLGYISGCFYPSYFFPEPLQRIAAFLPSGAAFSYMQSVMLHESVWKDLVLNISYTAFFSLLAFVARKHKIRVA